MKKLFFVFLSFFIANISSAQTSAKKTGRLDLSNFKKSDIRYEEYVPEDEISSTSSYVLLELEILPESYDFNNEPIVYKNGGRQTKVINGSEEITLQFKLTNKGTGIANDIKYNIVPESKLNGQKISNLFIPKFIGDPKSLDPGKSSYFSVTLKAALI